MVSRVVLSTWRSNLRGETGLLGSRSSDWFTGLPPSSIPVSLPQPSLSHVTRSGVQNYFDNNWTMYENLFSSLQGEEAFYRPPTHGLRHPMIFYYGHTAAFYVNKSVVAGVLKESVDVDFEKQFEVGVDEMRWDDVNKEGRVWPKVHQVKEFRKQVYDKMSRVIRENFSDDEPRSVKWNDPLWAVFMGCEHDRIHLETSSVLIRELPLELVRKPEAWPMRYDGTPKDVAPKNEFVSVNGGEVKLGKARAYPTYGWDNEYGSRVVDVKPFKASKDIVTNGEFLNFVKAGGYRERRFWSEDGWGWRRFRNMQAPHFWVNDGPQGSHKYKIRHMFDLGPFDASLPAVVNYHEAKAFCKWKASTDALPGLRLMTEAEHQLMLEPNQRMETTTPTTDPALLVNGEGMEKQYGINTNLAYSSERPVDAHKPNSLGFRDGTGNVWQWCEDLMAPFPGFEAHPYYGDFTEPCFDGKHYVIKGGSFFSSGDAGSNAHARYHFRPHFLQHSGFRYVLPSVAEIREGEAGGVKLYTEATTSEPAASVSATSTQQTQADYENDKMVSQYMALHFGQSRQQDVDATFVPHHGRPDGVLDFPRRCAAYLNESYMKHATKTLKKPTRALDLGCAVGGSSFSLASTGNFDQVVGVDLSSAFIKAANDMKITSSYNVKLEDSKTFGAEREINVELFGVEKANRFKTEFVVGDACAIPASLGQFDAMLGANLLCRLPDPHACLKQLPYLIRPGGVVLFVSPFSWLPSFTPREMWLGPVGASEKELCAEMKSLGFELVEEKDLPLVIREHRRKYQYIVSYGSVFRNDNK